MDDLHTCNSSLPQTPTCSWQDSHHVRRTKTGASPKEPAERIIRDISEPYVCSCGRLGVPALPPGYGHRRRFQSLAEFRLSELQGLAKSQNFAGPLGNGTDRFSRHMQSPKRTGRRPGPASVPIFRFITPPSRKSRASRFGADLALNTYFPVFMQTQHIKYRRLRPRGWGRRWKVECRQRSLELLFQKLKQTLIFLTTSSESKKRKMMIRRLRVLLIEEADHRPEILPQVSH